MYEQEKHDLRKNAARKLGLAGTEAVNLVALPEFRSRTARMPKWRAAKLRALLETRLRNALRNPAEPERADATEIAAPRAETDLCRTCRGACCQKGAEHGYIRQSTLKRVLREVPGITKGTIIARYLAHVPARSYRSSCIYHTAHGCALPRALRSETCLSFACPALQTSRAILAQPGQAILAVALKAGQPARRSLHTAPLSPERNTPCV